MSEFRSLFDPSLLGDSSDCSDKEPAEDLYLSDSTSISSEHEIKTPGKPSKGVGLGISGVRKHDGSGPFDGLGSVYIHSGLSRITNEAGAYPIPFQLSESLTQDPRDKGDAEILDTFLQEAAMTFIQDPFHIHSLAAIPECPSWPELDNDEREMGDSVSSGIRDEIEISHALPESKVSTSGSEAPLGRMRKHFSASTISSDLKRTSASARRIGTRTRSPMTWNGMSVGQALHGPRIRVFRVNEYWCSILLSSHAMADKGCAVGRDGEADRAGIESPVISY